MEKEQKKDKNSKIPSSSIQDSALAKVSTIKFSYKNMCQKRRRQLVDLYREVMSYESEKQADWSSSLKVNFANQVEQLVTSRLTAKSPKFIVSMRVPAHELAEKMYPKPKFVEEFEEAEKSGQPLQEAMGGMDLQVKEWRKEREKFEKEVNTWAKEVQTYLDYVFGDAYEFSATLRRMAKALVRNGNVYGMVDWKVKNYRTKDGEKVVSKKLSEYPCLNNVSFTETYLDPRFIQTADSPAVIVTAQNVRYGELVAQKKEQELFNLDKIKTQGGTPTTNSATDYDKYMIYNIMITSPDGTVEPREFKTLTVDKYFGYFAKTEDDDDYAEEQLYEIWVVNQCLVIKIKEITEIPVISAGCFEDPEQHFSIGYVEPILGLQREYNFKLNSGIEYINHALNRSYFWDPQSGIDPKSLANASAPNAIIPVTKGIEAAKNGLLQIENKEINQSYFAQNNEIRRDMQSVSFTIDTSQPTSTQGFTNTATAVRARFFETNTVYADTLKHFEEFLVRLAYSVLEKIAQNATEDIYLPEQEKRLKPQLFTDSMLRYVVRVEVGSSSFDTLESRREDALALWTLAKDYKASGGNPNIKKVWDEVLGTFEKRNVDEYTELNLEPLMNQMGMKTPKNLEALLSPQKPGLDNVSELSKEVVQGNLTP